MVGWVVGASGGVSASPVDLVSGMEVRVGWMKVCVASGADVLSLYHLLSDDKERGDEVIQYHCVVSNGRMGLA